MFHKKLVEKIKTDILW